MINKKGAAIHVDWAISMGMFLIAVITFLILLRPGVQELTETRTLMEIVEKNFDYETLYEVKSIPLHILGLSGEGPGDNPPEIIVTATKLDTGDEKKTYTVGGKKVTTSSKDLGSKWSFSKFEKTGLKGDGVDATGGMAGRIKLGDVGSNKFSATCTVGVCRLQTFPIILIAYQTEVDAPVPIFKLRCSPDEPDYCEGQLGSSEITKGYNLFWIGDLIREQEQLGGYEAIKERWGYPITSDFAIYIQKEGERDPYIIGNLEQPPQQANVRAKQIKSFILNNDGTKQDATVSIRVW